MIRRIIGLALIAASVALLTMVHQNLSDIAMHGTSASSYTTYTWIHMFTTALATVIAFAGLFAVVTE